MDLLVRQAARPSRWQRAVPAWRCADGATPNLSSAHRFVRASVSQSDKVVRCSSRSFRQYQRTAPSSHRSFTMSAVRAAPGKKTVDYLLADVGEGITECEIVKWFVEPGAHVEEFDVLVEVQSDKASVEITSRYTGKVVEHCHAVGQVAKVGSPLCRIEMVTEEDTDAVQEPTSSSAEKSLPSASVEQSIPPVAQEQQYTGNGRHQALATPAVRRITRENNVDIAKVAGTGKDGRVTKEDVQQYLANKNTSSATPVLSSSSGTTTVPLSGIRKAMFKGMTSTWTAPHFGYSDEIDVTQLDHIRKQLASRTQLAAEGQEVKLTLLPFLLKAMSIALNDHPIFRSRLDAERMTLSQTEEHSLSLAFASPKGLLTPTLRGDVRALSVIDIARQMSTLQRNASTRGLTQDELGRGGTVTLSNIGSIGGTHTFPLLPPTGQLVIGAVGRTRILPRFNSFDEVVKASILPVSFSADHRVVEGVELARFVSDWKALLENPSSWLLNLR